MKKIIGSFELKMVCGNFRDNSFSPTKDFKVILYDRDFNKSKYELIIGSRNYMFIKTERDDRYKNIDIDKHEYIFLPNIKPDFRPDIVRSICENYSALDVFSKKVITYFNNTENSRFLLKNLKAEELNKFLFNNADWIEWSAVHNNEVFNKLYLNTIDTFKDEIDWNFIVGRVTLNLNLLNHVKDRYISLSNLVKYRKLPEQFIENNLSTINYRDLFACQELSENFIRKHLDIVNLSTEYWDRISNYSYLSYEFLEEFKDKLNWDNVARYNNFREKTLRAFWDRLPFSSLSHNFASEYSLRKKYGILSFSSFSDKRTLREIDCSTPGGWIKVLISDIAFFCGKIKTIFKK